MAYVLISCVPMIILPQLCWLTICSNFSYFFYYSRAHLSGIGIGAGLTLAFVAGFWALGYLREVLTLFLICSSVLYGVIAFAIIVWAGVLVIFYH